ncbi:MAG: 1-acyl-sn-glycerol-3-phosphate acyltransferase [Bdellovibrionales bacterium]|nr:1-acyl-sn-glycerol-3-phosphate acyltransferase [Bdellovibrionales bacterium]
MSAWGWDYENEQWTKLPSYLKHLPLFTRHFDLTSKFFRLLWAIFLKFFGYRFYIPIKVVGEFHTVAKSYPKLIVIANHASHLDATSMAAAIPFRYWPDLYIAAAKDYFFGNPIFAFFSKHCLGAIPIDRKDKKGEAIKLCLSLLNELDRIWMIFFPEGTRSPDGAIQEFRRGIELFSEHTSTPILFLSIKGNASLWPKGRLLPKPGKLEIHIGPVCPPGPKEMIHERYTQWGKEVDPGVEIKMPVLDD